MKFKLEKSIRIINELIVFFNNHGGSDINIRFISTESTSNYIISARINTLSQDELLLLSNTLNLPRQHEIEEYYWNLGGDSEDSSELDLIGMMIDSSTITYENNTLTINLVRNESN